jgi:hypothetical protein
LTGWIQAQISHNQSLPRPVQLARAALMPSAYTRGTGMLGTIRAELLEVRVEVDLTPQLGRSI